MSEWIKWEGGDHPISDNTPHEVRFEDGDICYDEQPQYWNWTHKRSRYKRNIIAYRLVEIDQ